MNNRQSLPTVPCRICEIPTTATAIKICAGCWEVESRLAEFLLHAEGRRLVQEALRSTLAAGAHPVILIPGVCEAAEWSGYNLVAEDGRLLVWVFEDIVETASTLGCVQTGLVETALECLRRRGFAIPGEFPEHAVFSAPVVRGRTSSSKPDIQSLRRITIPCEHTHPERFKYSAVHWCPECGAIRREKDLPWEAPWLGADAARSAIVAKLREQGNKGITQTQDDCAMAARIEAGQE